MKAVKYLQKMEIKEKRIEGICEEKHKRMTEDINRFQKSYVKADEFF